MKNAATPPVSYSEAVSKVNRLKDDGYEDDDDDDDIGEAADIDVAVDVAVPVDVWDALDAMSCSRVLMTSAG